MSLLTPSLMSGDCFATLMAGEEEEHDVIVPHQQPQLCQATPSYPRVEILLERDLRERAPPDYGSLFRQ